MTDEKKINQYFVGAFKYEGYELTNDDKRFDQSKKSTHIQIFDTTKKKKFDLPINNTVVGEK